LSGFYRKSYWKVELDPSEVKDFKWLEWEGLRRKLRSDRKGEWSEWCKEEVELVSRALEKNKKFIHEADC
jgi:isopentenyldiphosphate isomerase